MNTGLASLYVYSLAIDPANPATLYAGTYDSGISRAAMAERPGRPSIPG